MARTYYSELHFHLVWHTKESLPFLQGPVEVETHRFLRGYLINTPGAFVHEAGGTDTHVHLAVTLPPTALLSELVGRLKGASAHAVNQKFGEVRKILQWQAGYGCVTFGTKDLPWVAAYIRDQRAHHARDTLHERLERSAPPEDGPEGGQREAP